MPAALNINNETEDWFGIRPAQRDRRRYEAGQRAISRLIAKKLADSDKGTHDLYVYQNRMFGIEHA